MFARGGREFGSSHYHWFFLAQPAPLPETLIGADPAWFWRWHTTRGPDTSFFDDRALEDYLSCFSDPDTIRGICEDYRAGATIDFDHDMADKAEGRKIECPLLVLWSGGGQSTTGTTSSKSGANGQTTFVARALPCGHYLAEEAPKETVRALMTFLSEPASPIRSDR